MNVRIDDRKRQKEKVMENERKKKFQDYAPPEQKPSGGYNLNGVYYSRDGQRLDDQPKKSWSQREYEREFNRYSKGV